MEESFSSPVVFFEMPANDMNRAKEFYEKVLGWHISPDYENYYFINIDTYVLLMKQILSLLST